MFNILLILFLYRFIVKDRATSYSSAQRSLIVMQILLRAKFDDTDKVSDVWLFGLCIICLKYVSTIDTDSL